MTPLLWAFIGHTILWAIWAGIAEIISYKKGVKEGNWKHIGWGNRLIYYITCEFQLLLILFIVIMKRRKKILAAISKFIERD